MCSSTSSKGPRLVRIAVPCAQTRVAIEMHSWHYWKLSMWNFYQNPMKHENTWKCRENLCHRIFIDYELSWNTNEILLMLHVIIWCYETSMEIFPWEFNVNEKSIIVLLQLYIYIYIYSWAIDYYNWIAIQTSKNHSFPSSQATTIGGDTDITGSITA